MAALMIQYYSILIYITFITYPQIGSGTRERFRASLDLCRTFEQMESERGFGINRMLLGLYLTGLTLGEKSHPKGM